MPLEYRLFQKDMINIAYNRKLYLRYMLVWAFSIAICFMVSASILFLSGRASSTLDFSLIIALVFMPLVVTSIYGFYRGYSITHNYGHICYGRRAVITNSFLMALYIIIVVYNS